MEAQNHGAVINSVSCQAPLGALGGLGLLSDEFVVQPPPESEPMVAAVDAEAPPQLSANSGVPADVDAILSSALSELGLSMTATDGADDRRITVSGEQMAAAVLAWQTREGAAVDE